jgi:hypothetical protein
MVHGDGMILFRQIDSLLGLPQGNAYLLCRRGVFAGHRIKNRIWAVTERELPSVLTRISNYRDRLPFYPRENMTVGAAARVLGLQEGTIYVLAGRGELEWARDELWKMPTRESVDAYLYRREGRRLAV